MGHIRIWKVLLSSSMRNFNLYLTIIENLQPFRLGSDEIWFPKIWCKKIKNWPTRLEFHTGTNNPVLPFTINNMTRSFGLVRLTLMITTFIVVANFIKLTLGWNFILAARVRVNLIFQKKDYSILPDEKKLVYYK